MPELIFPQLSSGATAQFPLRKWRTYHIVRNTTEDGEDFSYFDPASGIVFWNLLLTNLTQAEVAQLEALFTGCSGRWASFLFLDPADNLFTDSADLTNSAWTAASGVTVTTGVADPQGGVGAFQITNQSQVVGTFGQTLTAPPNLTYAFSVFVRAASSSIISLARTSGAQEVLEQVVVTTQWTRVFTKEQLTQPGSSITFGFQLQPGQQVQVFGLQCEAQPMASEFYRPTYGTGGVYPNAYFAMDALKVSADAPGQYSTSIAIEATR